MSFLEGLGQVFVGVTVVVMLVLMGYGFAVGSYEAPPLEPTPVVVTIERPIPAPDPRYIVVERLGLEFTEEAYHERVRDQIEEDGYDLICREHLESLVWNAAILSVNSARQSLAYVTECARMEPQPDSTSPEDTTP